MNILAIDTSYKNLIIIATKGDKTCIKQSTDQVKQHNSLILPMIDEVLKEIGLDISEIDYFSAVVGPGSFTGIRLGVCTQNAFAQVFNKKLVAVNALEILAYSKTDSDKNCDSLACGKTDSDKNCDSLAYGKSDSDKNCDSLAYGKSDSDKNCDILACIDARHNNFYCGKFAGSYQNQVELCNLTGEDLQAFKGVVVVQNDTYDTQAFLAVVKNKIANNQFIEQLEPLYLKKSQAEREEAERKNNVN